MASKIMNKIFKIVIKEIVLRRLRAKIINLIYVIYKVQITLNINKNKNMPTLNYLFIRW